MMFIQVFGKESITRLDWDSVKNGKVLRKYYEPLVKNSSKIFVRNSDHQVEILQVGTELYPLTIGRKSNKKTCYLFSLKAQYIDYTREEVLKGSSYNKSQKAIVKFFFPFLRVFGSWMGMERTVFVNNFFLATNLYEKDTLLSDTMVTQYLKEYYPNCVIAFRSINESTDSHLLNKLKLHGGLPLACRQLYILDPKHDNFQKKRPVIRDRKLWEKTKDLYWQKVLRFDKIEISTLLTFYRDLYLKKYSQLNPDYSADFLEASMNSKILDFYILREISSDVPLAVQAVERTKHVVCTPFIGYDHMKPKNIGLYRLMHLKLSEIAIEEDKIFNMSSGASTFKKQRGGVPCFDYHIIFIDHLPKRVQWFWKQLYSISESIIKPAMKNLKV
ncbi:hypothetical protein [Croceitalea rosinachiae]|uniref:Acetyltransferase (GNAT) domain-containing protein n=1 Tax=Croceitalea rosinachiae TaxID=3075596 RepID=A0ABU3ADQ3_9FLAO|nr:hypothetical protein [Croceitalea sp. F388]MDT0608317.1 hypothetical protein [Croceitalea sp. F388]